MKNPNGYGTIVNLGKGRRRPYAVRITLGWTKDKRQKYKYIGYYTTQREANLALADYNRNPYDISKRDITFKEVFELWSESKFKTIKQSTINTHNVSFKKCESIYNKPFVELRKAHLQKIIDDQGTSTIKRPIKNLFSQLYKFGLENDICEKDYSKFVTIIDDEQKKERIPFTDAEIKTLWENLWKVRNVDIMLILLYTGLRIGELLDIKKENVFLEDRYMIGGNKTKAGINRIIPICDKIYPVIKWNYENSNIEYLIMNSRGKKMNYSTFIKHQWEQTRLKLGMNHVPHDARHTFISRLDNLGVDNLIIKRIVGHANSDVTERYTHKDVPKLLEAVNKLD